jgi:hypothetical protein
MGRRPLGGTAGGRLIRLWIPLQVVVVGGCAGQHEKSFDPAHDHSIICRAIGPNVTAHIRAVAALSSDASLFRRAKATPPRLGLAQFGRTTMHAAQSVAGLTMVFALALSINASSAAGQTSSQSQPGSVATSASSDTKQHVGDSGGDGGDALRRFSQHQQVDGQGGDGGDALRAFGKQKASGEGGSAALDRFTHTGKASE